MSVEGDLHAALMAEVEKITGYPVLWPQRGGDKPAGEHLTVAHLPNDNERRFLSASQPLGRMGYIVIYLVSPLGVYEAVSKAKAGDIAETLPIGTRLTVNGQIIRVHNHTIKQGSEVGGRWETPIWIDYRGFA